MPKTLRKIFTTLDKQIEFGRYLDLTLGNLSLSYLTQQGVLLLNSRLTIRENESNSHREAGWDVFIARILLSLASRRKGLFFTAWGSEAKKILSVVHDKHRGKHYFHSCEHPVAANYAKRDWDNKNCFNKINKYLERTKQKRIIW